MKQIFAVFAIIAMSLSIQSCKSKPKDADIKTSVESAIMANPLYSNVRVVVKDAVVDLSGEVQDAASKASLETTVAGVKGVKTVNNNTTLAAVVVTPDPVISGDDALRQGVTDALKDHPTLSATVTDGVVTVSGETTAAKWKMIKMTLDGLQPKKVDGTRIKIK